MTASMIVDRIFAVTLLMVTVVPMIYAFGCLAFTPGLARSKILQIRGREIMRIQRRRRVQGR